MIEPPRLGRRNALVLRSHLPLEVGLSAYALVAALLLGRAVFLAVGISDRVWSGAALYQVTEPLVWPLTFFPGAERDLVGRASLPDVTAVGIVALVPLALLARDRSR